MRVINIHARFRHFIFLLKIYHETSFSDLENFDFQ